jgi:RNA polymerase sigma-70 factor (ECF subfamily)
MTRSPEELLAAHLAGDPRAFDELWLRLAPTLYSVAGGALDSREDADEAVQDALVRAFQNAGRFRGESSVTTWVVKILLNVCRDRQRHNRARPADPVAEMEAYADPRDSMSAVDTRMDLEAALDELPAHQRLPIVLVDLLEYPVAEAADLLGVPTGTVKSRCSRGRARMLVTLREEVA